MMKTYQEMILERLEEVAQVGRGAVMIDVTVAYDYSNRGRMTVTRTSNLKTLATADFDFQAERVHVLLNSEGGPRSMMVSGGAHDARWRIGNPDDDSKVTELFNQWDRLITEALQ